jgi:hypothetical protein
MGAENPIRDEIAKALGLQRQRLIESGMSEPEASALVLAALEKHRIAVHSALRSRLHALGLETVLDSMLHEIDPDSPAH